MSAPAIRWSIWALPLAGVFIALSWVYDPAGRLVLADPDGYARAVTSTFYMVEGYSSLIGFVLLLFGLVALYGHLSSPAASPWNTAGMILSVAGAAFLLAVSRSHPRSSRTTRAGYHFRAFDPRLPLR